MFSTIKSLCIFNVIQNCSILDINSWEKLIEWLADNKFNYLNWYWRESSLSVTLHITFHINLIQADLEANDLIDHGQLFVQCFWMKICLQDANDLH